MDNQLEILTQRIAYYERVKILLENETRAVNGLIGFYETNASSENEETALKFNLEIARLRLREAEIENDIDTKTQQIEEYSSRIQMNDETSAWLEAMRKNSDFLRHQLKEISKDVNIPPPAQDRAKALLRNLQSDDFTKMKDQSQIRVYAMIADLIQQFTEKPKQKLILEA